MFLEVIDSAHNEEVIINTDSISCIYPQAKTIIMNGVHGKGNGILHLNKTDIQMVLDKIGIMK